MDGSSQLVALKCSEAAAGYATAMTAAYTEMLVRTFDFWSTALEGLDANAKPVCEIERLRQRQQAILKAIAATEPAFGLSPTDWSEQSWSPFDWLDPRRFERLMGLEVGCHPVSAAVAVAETVPMRGCAPARGMAKVMIDSGMPRSVAWPAAEAGAAALSAADTASSGIRKVVASYHAESGYAGSVAGMAPSVVAVAMLAGLAVMPLQLMLGAVKV